MRLAAARFFAFSVTLAAALGASREARAQVISGISGPVTRLESDGVTSADTLHPHGGGVPINAVNYEDCSANLVYGFPLTLAGASSSYNLVAYAGPNIDCTVYANRDTNGVGKCFPVSGTIAQTSAKATTALIRMQDLALQAAAAGDGTSTVDVTYSAATASSCTAQPTSAASSLTLYFFFVDQQGYAIGVGQAYPITVDTQAAVVNGSISAGSNTSSVDVAIPSNADSDITGYNIYCDPPPGQEGAQNNVYFDAASNGGICVVDSGSTTTTTTTDASSKTGDDASSLVSDASPEASLDAQASGTGTEDASTLDASPADAGAADAGGADAGAADAAPITEIDDSGASACGVVLNDGAVIVPTSVDGCYPSAVFSASSIKVATTNTTTDEGGTSTSTNTKAGYPQSSIPSKYLCGYASATDTTVNIAGLKNGYYYNIAVAATDAVGNVGPLATTCGNPDPLIDFYSRYADAGGLAGGGYCATDGVGVPAGTGGLFLLVVSASAALVRRRMRSRARA